MVALLCFPNLTSTSNQIIFTFHTLGALDSVARLALAGVTSRVGGGEQAQLTALWELVTETRVGRHGLQRGMVYVDTQGL